MSISNLSTQPRGQVKFFASMLVFTSFHLISYMQHNYFLKKMFWPFPSTQGVEGVCKDRIFTCMLQHLSFPLIGNVLKKVEFGPHRTGLAEGVYG